MTDIPALAVVETGYKLGLISKEKAFWWAYMLLKSRSAAKQILQKWDQEKQIEDWALREDLEPPAGGDP